MSEKTAFMNQAATDFEGWSRWMTKLLKAGVATGLSVSQRALGANMSVDIAAGDLIPMTTDTAPHSWETGTYNQVIGAASANNRRDIVVAYVDLSVTNPSTSTPNNPGALKFKVVQGTPATSPSDPSDVAIQASVGAGNPWEKLARVSLTSSTTQITNAQITDLRRFVALNIQRLRGGASSTLGHLVPDQADGVFVTTTDVKSVTPGMISKFPILLTPKIASSQKIFAGTPTARTGLTWTFTAPYTGYADCLAGLFGRPDSATIRDVVAYWLAGGSVPPSKDGSSRGITPSDNPGLQFQPYGLFPITAGNSYTLAVYVSASYNAVDFGASSNDWGRITLYPTEFTMVA